MSSSASATPLTLELQPSRRLALALGTVYAGVAAALFSLPLSLTFRCLLLVVLAGIGIVSCRTQVLLRHRRSVIRLVWRTDGEWLLQQRDGMTLSARLLSSSFLHPQLVVLNFTCGRWRCRHVVLLPDSAGPAQLRRLRVRLRLLQRGGDGVLCHNGRTSSDA